MERYVDELQGGVRGAWTGLSYQEKLASGQALSLYLISLLVVPLGVLGAVSLSLLRGLPNDIYFKIGLITVIGLAAKNAILIVEFAVAEQQAGRTLREATIDAARLRLRPILMTSLAFILGVFPLFISSGAGANSRHAIGTGVIGGMLFATFLGLLLIPVFYVVVRRLLGDKLDGDGKSRPASGTDMQSFDSDPQRGH
jgi:multidrug efflux pump